MCSTSGFMVFFFDFQFTVDTRRNNSTNSVAFIVIILRCEMRIIWEETTDKLENLRTYRSTWRRPIKTAGYWVLSGPGDYRGVVYDIRPNNRFNRKKSLLKYKTIYYNRKEKKKRAGTTDSEVVGRVDDLSASLSSLLMGARRIRRRRRNRAECSRPQK